MIRYLLVFSCSLTVLASLPALVRGVEVPAGYDRYLRPNPEAGPTPVQVGVFVIDLIEIDDIHQSFTANLYFDVRYSDPRLADPNAPEVRVFAVEQIWWPNLGLVNRRNLDVLFPNVLKVDRRGNVTYNQRVYGDFSARLSLRRFPFDSQLLPIEVASFSLSPKELNLTMDPDFTGRFESLSLTGWEVLTGGIDTLPKRAEAVGLEQLTFHLNVARRIAFYRWSILVPLGFIVLMAWCVFWIDPQYLPTQVGLSTASVFSLIAFRFSLRALLPRVDYMTYLDEFVLASTVLVFLALGQAILTGRLAKIGHEPLADRIDVWSRSIYLLVFAILTVLTLRLHF